MREFFAEMVFDFQILLRTFTVGIQHNLLVRLQDVEDMLARPSTAPNLTCISREARKEEPLLFKYGT